MPVENVDIATADGVADAYLARPDDQPHPGVLFIMDAFGLRPTIAEMTERIAADGYVVLAPNIFYRAGRAPVLPMPDLSDPEQRTAFFGSIRPLAAQLSPDGIRSDASAYLDRLSEAASPGPVAITGYCMGARVGWRIATDIPERVAALAGFHGGGLVTDAPDSPHHSATELRAEVYFGFADQDAGMTADQILDGVDATISSVVGRPLKRIAGLIKSWTHDPWSRAVVRAPIGDQRTTILPLIAAPLGSRLFFAGEHTDARVGPGGMEGAVKSGYRVAKEVLE